MVLVQCTTHKKNIRNIALENSSFYLEKFFSLRKMDKMAKKTKTRERKGEKEDRANI